MKQEYRNRFKILKGGKISLIVSALCMHVAVAAPQGGNVVSGSANINQNGDVTNIHQSSQKASINWNSFNVSKQETVNFNQPNKNAITLNRVVGNERSVINGALNANGQVWILNSNGVLFGKNARVNTAGLLATTREISDQDFQAGNYKFVGDSDESVINLGEIEIKDGGYAALLGKSVSNEGTIKAIKGRIELVGAQEYLINLNGNSLVNVKVEKSVVDALVENKGLIKADGGKVYLTTSSAQELIKGVVNNSGVIEANSIDDITSEVILFAHGGRAEIAGRIEASEGFVETSGKQVKIDEAFDIKAKKWLIDPTNFTIAASGGDLTGAFVSNTLNDENRVEDFVISADGTNEGEGNIFVNDSISWSQGHTLRLEANNKIFINNEINITGPGGLFLHYNINDIASGGGNEGYYVNAPINMNNTARFITQQGTNNAVVYEIISTKAELDAMQSDGDYALGRNIDLAGNSFSPLAEYTGNFDGLGHTVDNFVLNVSNADVNKGFFEETSSATIRNFGLTNIDLDIEHDGWTGYQDGGLIGRSVGTSVINSYVTGNITSTAGDIGGMVGYVLGGAFINSYTSVNIEVNSGIDKNIGGFIGEVDSNTVIKNSYSTGDVTGTKSYVGGFIGSVSSSSQNFDIQNTYSLGKVTNIDSSRGARGGYIGKIYTNNDITAIKNSLNLSDTGVNQYIKFDGGYIMPFENSKSSLDLQNIETFNLRGWDIQVNNSIETDNPYPFLSSDGTSVWKIGRYSVPVPITSVTPESPVTPEVVASETNSTTNTIQRVVTAIINKKAVKQPDVSVLKIPKLQVSVNNLKVETPSYNAPTNIGETTVNRVKIVSSPQAEETTTSITQTQVQTMQNSESTVVPVDKDSLVSIVDSGVNLPEGMEQIFFVVPDEK